MRFMGRSFKGAYPNRTGSHDLKIKIGKGLTKRLQGRSREKIHHPNKRKRQYMLCNRNLGSFPIRGMPVSRQYAFNTISHHMLKVFTTYSISPSKFIKSEHKIYIQVFMIHELCFPKSSAHIM